MILRSTGNVHRNLQGDRATSLETHLDKALAIVYGSENRGPYLRFVDQRVPPELTNVCQLHEGIDAVSGAGRCDQLENREEDLEGDFVDGAALFGKSLVALSRIGRLLDGCSCQKGYGSLWLPYTGQWL